MSAFHLAPAEALAGTDVSCVEAASQGCSRHRFARVSQQWEEQITNSVNVKSRGAAGRDWEVTIEKTVRFFAEQVLLADEAPERV